MPADTFATFGHRITKLIGSFKDPELKRTMTKVGRLAQKIAAEEASRDLGGDPKFSGWAPKLDTKADYLGDGRISFHPTRPGAGPWTVAERGRNQGNAGGFAGPGIGRGGLTARTKSGGLRKVRAVKAKRWNGTTAPKNTATRATARIERETVPIIEKAVAKAVRDFFN